MKMDTAMLQSQPHRHAWYMQHRSERVSAAYQCWSCNGRCKPHHRLWPVIGHWGSKEQIEYHCPCGGLTLYDVSDRHSRRWRETEVLSVIATNRGFRATIWVELDELKSRVFKEYSDLKEWLAWYGLE